MDFPGLNPFDIEGKESLSDKDADDYTDEFISAFKEILEGNLTDQMETLLRNTIPVIVKMPGTTVYDLIDFLRPKAKALKGDADNSASREYRAKKYLDFANAHFENQVMLDFLSTQFEEDWGYIATRNSLTTRLLGIFGSTLMQGLFKGDRTIRFEALIPERKLVVFNLAGLKSGTEVIGRFILITLKIFALNQAKVAESRRVPCHVLVDECQKFITKSMVEILQEARKFYVFLTLAQQSAGGGMDAAMFESVLINSANKAAGATSGQSLNIMAKEIGVLAESITEFKAGQFAIYQREGTPKRTIVRMPTDTLHNRNGMNPTEWRSLLKEQIHRYYRHAPDRETAPSDNYRAAAEEPAWKAALPINHPLSVNLDQFLT